MKKFILTISVTLTTFFYSTGLRAQSDSAVSIPSSIAKDTVKTKPAYWYPIIVGTEPGFLPIDSAKVLDFRIAKYMNQGAKDLKSAYLLSCASLGIGLTAATIKEKDLRIASLGLAGLSGIIGLGLGVSAGINFQKASDLMMLKVCPSCVSINFYIR